MITRAKAILDRVFDTDAEQSLFISYFSCLLTDASGWGVISITAHCGIINAILMAVGRQKYGLPTGGT